MEFELCIFDLDGTLVDTRDDITAAANDMRAHYGLAAKGVDEIIGYVGDGVRKLVERCIGARRVNIDEAVSIYREAYSRHLLDTTIVYPGVYEMLDRLQCKGKAVLTNKPYDFTKIILDNLGLIEYFSVVVGGDTLRTKKPSPECVNYILKNTGFDHEKVIMIGDGKTDVLTAKKAGIKSVYVTYGFSTAEKLEGLSPDFTVGSPRELLDIC